MLIITCILLTQYYHPLNKICPYGGHYESQDDSANTSRNVSEINFEKAEIPALCG